ncbi:MAG: nucleoside diphosphate kinase regulator [Rhodospirillales bacterium]|jgi:regulator of nucleoside diphosphate kinase|nr:nucleoside diphosphate kinase regulator [Rhodospirillales bacterium]
MSQTLPPIVMTRHEHGRLSELADVVWSKYPEFCDFLLRELGRAEVVAEEEIGSARVTMGCRVEFAYRDSGVREVVTLVFPPDADISKGRVSILTPVGTALIGLAEGQSITFRTRRGEERTLSVLRVRHPEDAR